MDKILTNYYVYIMSNKRSEFRLFYLSILHHLNPLKHIPPFLEIPSFTDIAQSFQKLKSLASTNCHSVKSS